MNEISELQTGQVAFLSGLLAGFALSIAVAVLRNGLEKWIAQVVFLSLLATTLLFLIALYVDVRMTIEIAAIDLTNPEIATNQLERLIVQTRTMGTSCATAAFVLLVVSIGLLGWLHNNWLGLVSTAMSLLAMYELGRVWMAMSDLQVLVSS